MDKSSEHIGALLDGFLALPREQCDLLIQMLEMVRREGAKPAPLPSPNAAERRVLNMMKSAVGSASGGDSSDTQNPDRPPVPFDPSRISQYHFTPRELQVLELMCRGLTAKEIARELNISWRTVEVHRTRAIAKFGARSGLDLVRLVTAEMLRP